MGLQGIEDGGAGWKNCGDIGCGERGEISLLIWRCGVGHEGEELGTRDNGVELDGVGEDSPETVGFVGLRLLVWTTKPD